MADILPFSANITEETLIASTRLHNRFAPDTAFPQIDVLSDGFKELCAIIAKYNAQSHFRLRLLHRHTTIPEGHILFGTGTTEPCGYWTRPTRISDIDLQKIHPHIISVDTASCTTDDEKRDALLFPSEFREGPLVSVGYIDGNFFTEFTHCLWTKGLGNTLGLEVIQGQAGKMIEFSFDIGSLLLQEDKVAADVRDGRREYVTLRETGWSVTVKDGLVDTTGETRCVEYSTGHVKATDTRAKSLSGAVEILRDEGIFAT
ncbi:hypothetical protein BKA61DRAFT_621264 [Leptodontidium sp. MPI-SDFR-AT-0119]|nr:hypothetical protein BKA61DRAFT_621264 [Leptodontidium sp. MPI-SDFR-AT-0119]